eukprot:TRINITY_DN12631_c0_g1_i1.p1 TRINITY_DN12631_c0_g1~~TRINITY_DN12631_c0_g1_i1.p1  ORF type:complete len:363 (+),score=79.48 TRINITY_DN12631_c0_g1_i1:50-1138(+)
MDGFPLETPLRMNDDSSDDQMFSDSSDSSSDDEQHDSNPASFLDKELGKFGVTPDTNRVPLEVRSLTTPSAFAPIQTTITTAIPTTTSPSKAKGKRGGKEPKEKEGKKRAKKEKDGPKRATNPYNYFLQVKREECKQEILKNQPTISPKEITAQVARIWKEMPESAKQIYHEMAAADKRRYQQEMKDFKTLKPQEPEPPLSDHSSNSIDVKPQITTMPMRTASPSPSIPVQNAREIPSHISVPSYAPQSSSSPIPMHTSSQRSAPPSPTAALSTQRTASGMQYPSKILKIRKKGDRYFERVRIIDYSYQGLLEKIRTKFGIDDGIKLQIINLPNIWVSDTEGVECLPDDTEIEWHDLQQLEM